MGANLRAVLEVESVRGVKSSVFAVFDITRCYPLYGLLCGLRGLCEPVIAPRGLPGDVTDEAMDWFEKEHEGNEHISYFYRSELQAVQRAYGR